MAASLRAGPWKAWALAYVIMSFTAADTYSSRYLQSRWRNSLPSETVFYFNWPAIYFLLTDQRCVWKHDDDDDDDENGPAVDDCYASIEQRKQHSGE